MAAPTPVAIRVNPNNSAQFYVLWGTGRIDNHGGAAPIVGTPTWYDRPDQPVAVDIHITSWSATPSGYIFDKQGGFHEFGSAPAITSGGSGDSLPTNNNGLTYVDHDRYVNFEWDPAGNGQGYAIDHYGEIFEFGGAPDAPRQGPRFTTPTVRAFKMSWTGGVKKAVSLDASGGIWLDFATTAPSSYPPYFQYREVTTDLAITDWSTLKGYVLTTDGAAHGFGGAIDLLAMGPYRADMDTSRLIHVLNVSSPTRIRQVLLTGQVVDYTASTPPTVTLNSPAATITTTTRPVVGWGYSDAQADAQAVWEVYVFAGTNTVADPAASVASALVYETGINPTVRGMALPIDLANGSFRAYVRVQDAAGQWSAWATGTWTQNVPLPPTPTGLSATPNADPLQRKIHLAVNTSGTAKYVRFEYTDDGGTTFTPVLGAEAVTRIATTLAVDYDVPLGPTRGYRAISYSIEPRVASAPSTAAYTSTNPKSLAHVLTSTADRTLGGELLVIDAPSWTREFEAGVFETRGSEFPTVVSGGPPKSQRFSLGIECDRKAEWDKVWKLVKSDSTLVYRTPFGEVIYCRVVGGLRRSQNWLPPYVDETTPLRHNHKVEIPLVQVAQPKPAVVSA